jgi:hypothetical protein
MRFGFSYVVNVSIGVYADVSASNGPHEVGASVSAGISSKKGESTYSDYSSTEPTGDSGGFGGSISVG